MTTRSKLLVGGALLVTCVGGGLGTVNFALDDSKVNAYAMTGEIHEIVVKSDNGNIDLVPASGRVQVRETQHFVSQKPTLDRTLRGGDYAVDADTDSGDVNVTGISRNDHAAKSIKARSDSGDVTLRAR